MDYKEQYEEETGLEPWDKHNSDVYTEEYVEWLENKLDEDHKTNESLFNQINNEKNRLLIENNTLLANVTQLKELASVEDTNNKAIVREKNKRMAMCIDIKGYFYSIDNHIDEEEYKEARDQVNMGIEYIDEIEATYTKQDIENYRKTIGKR